MGEYRHRELRHAYGFDEVAIVPGDFTINPELADTSFAIGGLKFSFPIIAAALDAAVDPSLAIAVGKLGGLAVMNLEGLQTRYADAAARIEEVAAAPANEATALLQRLYQEPVKEQLAAQRVEEIKAGGVPCAVAATPAMSKRLAPAVQEAGADVYVVQSTVTTARHFSRSPRGLILSELCSQLRVPVVVGNCVSYSAARELMEAGIAGLLVGVGPGAICTSREVLGIGVPQVTATMDCAAARDDYYRETGRYVTLVTDGGLRTGGDVCKAIVAGADGVMLGTSFAQTKEAPGRGFSWGMAAPDPSLPRGTRVKVGVQTTLQQLLFGPTTRTDGTHNLVGALRVAMGFCGAYTIQDMHQAQLVLAPAIKTEGKLLQLSQAS